MKSQPATRPYTQSVRALSAEATAQRIIDAFLARLMSQWFDEITLDLVAADAGVSVQTVVRRFGSKEGLLSNAVKILGAQINAQRATPSGDLGKLINNLTQDYERTGKAILRLLALEPRHAALREVLDFGRSEHRKWVSNAFAEPLARFKEEIRKRALDALIINTDVYVWKLLRGDMARSRAETTATIKLLVKGTLSEFSKLN